MQACEARAKRQLQIILKMQDAAEAPLSWQVSSGLAHPLTHCAPATWQVDEQAWARR